jgi:hypothetical protein
VALGSTPGVVILTANTLKLTLRLTVAPLAVRVKLML